MSYPVDAFLAGINAVPGLTTTLSLPTGDVVPTTICPNTDGVELNDDGEYQLPLKAEITPTFGTDSSQLTPTESTFQTSFPYDTVVQASACGATQPAGYTKSSEPPKSTLCTGTPSKYKVLTRATVAYSAKKVGYC